METLEKKQTTTNIVLRKIFDIKMKTGHEMKKAYVDEVILIVIPRPNF